MAFGKIVGAFKKFAESMNKTNIKQTMSSMQSAAVNRSTAFKTSYNDLKNKAFSSENLRRDPVVRMSRMAGKAGSRIGKWAAPVATNSVKKVGNFAARAGKRVATPGVFLVGATAMFGINFMKGGMNEARDIVHERYMQDYTYSKNMLQNSRLGLASGTNSMLNNGGTQGLSLALSKTRHGRF